MEILSPARRLWSLLLVLHLASFRPCIAQQAYVNNDQLDCNVNHNNTLGFLCNGPNPSCTAYITFRPSSPSYTTPPSIAYLLNSTAPDIALLNSVSDAAPLSPDRFVVVPVSCACTPNRRYYQHNATYRLKYEGETYYTTANITYQGLTTCQAMMAQNPNYNLRHLQVGEDLLVPIMCACPTAAQTARFGAKYLVSYLVAWGDTVSQIGEMFGVDYNSILDANELSQDSNIYPFTPILVPLKSEPTKINFLSPPPAPSPSTPTTGGGGSGGASSKKWVFVVIGVGGGILLLGVALLAWCLLHRRSKKPVSAPVGEKGGNKKTQDMESADFVALPGSSGNGTTSTLNSSSETWYLSLDGVKQAIGSLTVYKYEELQKATGDFSEVNRIKGSVFRGRFNGDDAAIKILRGNVDSGEISILKQINHSNIIRLSGFCTHEGNTYLVCEYAENGSLRDWLDNPNKGQSGPTRVLGWKERVRIACDVADALCYLHNYINPPYVHKNLKSSVVLLDANFKAKITNFGLARTASIKDEGGLYMTQNVVGTYGYMAPEYVENGVVTPKMDVFAFGVVLVELLSGKPAFGNELLSQVIKDVFEGDNIGEKLRNFMDADLDVEYPLDLAYSMAQVAKNCVAKDMNARPSMDEVSIMLSKIDSSSLDWDPSDELRNSSSLAIPGDT